jgi:hypothetical protein
VPVPAASLAPAYMQMSRSWVCVLRHVYARLLCSVVAGVVTYQWACVGLLGDQCIVIFAC